MTDEQTSDKTADSGKRTGKQGDPIKEMFILALLYLPLGFFLWFALKSPFSWFPGQLVEWALTGFFPQVVDQVVQLGFHLEIQTLLTRNEGRIALSQNPMIYAWGMPLIFGLTMATPISVKRRILQLVLGYLVVSLVTAWGVFWSVLVDLRGLPEGAMHISASIFSNTAINLCYMLGTLILPSVTAIALWVLMNRPFLEKVVFRKPR